MRVWVAVLVASLTFGVGLTMGFVVGAVAGSGASAGGSPGEGSPAEAAPKKKEAPKEPAGPPMDVSGTGSDVITISGLSAGAVTFSYEYEGEGNFIVELLDAEGKHVDLIANEVDSVSGSKVVRVREAGDYFVNVKADPGGSWTLRGPPKAQ